jgi:hypothetical protein
MAMAVEQKQDVKELHVIKHRPVCHHKANNGHHLGISDEILRTGHRVNKDVFPEALLTSGSRYLENRRHFLV